jgi:hypothetical protein
LAPSTFETTDITPIGSAKAADPKKRLIGRRYLMVLIKLIGPVFSFEQRSTPYHRVEETTAI